MKAEKINEDMEITFLDLLATIHTSCMQCGLVKSFDLHETYIDRALQASAKAYGLAYLNAQENGVNIEQTHPVPTYAEYKGQISERVQHLPAPTASELLTLKSMFSVSARKAEVAARHLLEKSDGTALPDTAMGSSLRLTEFIGMANHVTAAAAALQLHSKQATVVEGKPST